MKKMLAALLAAVLTLCFAAALAEDTGLADVKAKGTLVMGFDEEYPPMGFVDENGEYVALTLIWPRKSPTASAWSSSSSRSRGIPRSWSFPAKTSTASGRV